MIVLPIDPGDHAQLIAVAHHAIERELGVADERDPPTNGITAQICGVFVSVSVGKRLRGCIGTIEGEQPLAAEVANMARAAASRDPRFNPITANELDDLRVEISVLSPLRPINGPDDIHPGVDGLVVEGGTHRGLLLPQVAAERGWDAETFLGYTCDKAGLSADAWRDADTKLFAFNAAIVSEDH